MKNIIKLIIFTISLLQASISNALDVISHVPENPTKALILMHGWRQDANGMKWLTPKLAKDFPDMAIFYPTAPDQAPGGGYQWFVIPTLGSSMSEERMYKKMMSSALDNVDTLYELIDEIHTNLSIDYENIHIGGFSQGGFMAILAGITNNELLGKVISFSGVPVIFTEDFKRNDINSAPDILIIQGDNDNIIPADSFNLTDKTLKSQEIEADIKIIKNMPHTINDRAIEYAIEFLKN